ncbi:MAG: hypothetical protein A2268_16975 [Candidatus Raymondbacteria bacterium RifOxyA12_full_50_37]|uniref:Cyclic nucleotide-binding domain-containing protein n=1 Tax=Candidatus Raymondbacteria bacterium RIFOXYD12_FULL_49_13 TaxID=1817890 RepID=A0A1F7FCJ6_UNCRA|nr:MAG: hypothetical protein A2268_16975 [Candidatus Raymondbacteria bacterium RifOxyA12_full_50_37]OGJ86302.1 MAG: hypothetical protein A2248_16575 [Candidatus Raymondbacteria bacterium RIFOXYA2_FULL_49_16]OGJ89985.1 MAG: hypothetical protein A2350_08030 [Candidatus Raymondbacteria bacterium RifOxyB12_full_50_8]OGJ95840.1 MAG: hypothetical protein A2453_11885 [Candidatus Raymondbacteria bacterium RIFOXYC2_FULL_50_21]OGJ96517.1 MAG: hypothetical protein A2487_19905 [Candidatus Raymondbacteria b
MENAEFLKSISLFKDLDDTETRAVLALAKQRQLGKGEVLFDEGSAGNEFYLVKSGKVAIYKKVAGGKKRNLANLGIGAIIGELSLFDCSARSAMAEAAEESVLVVFEIGPFRECLEKLPAMAVKFQHQIILTLCSRVRDTNEKLNQSVLWGFKAQV